MCADNDYMDFSDLDEDVGAMVVKERETKALGDNPFHAANRIDTHSEAPGEKFPCEKCKGSGRVTFGYVNIQSGKCFKCNGRGYFKSSTEDRRAAKAKREQKKVNERKNLAAKGDAFLAANPDIALWLAYGEKTGFGFAVSLHDSLRKYGSWTEKQEAAARRCMEKFNAARKVREESPQDGLDLSPIPAGTYMVPDGDTNLRVAINRPSKGRWIGWTFVHDGSEYGSRRNYGKQAPDATYQGKLEAQLAEILKDPQEAMARYGRETGTCGVCSRVLEDPESVARGIGPVCLKKF